MSAKLIVLEEAAAMLGMSPEQLTKLRNDNEIFGYRDGKTWKFKQSEIERFAGQRGIEMRANPGDSVKIGGGNVAGAEQVDIDADLDELIDVAEINLDEPLLGSSEEAMVTDADQPNGTSSSSTIIGKSAVPDELGNELIETIGDDLESDGSETSVGLPQSVDADSIEIVDSDGSEIKLAEESGLVLGEANVDLSSSDLNLAPGSDISIQEEEQADEPIEIAEEPMNVADSGSELKLAAGSEVNLGDSDDEIVLADDEASDMEIDLGESLDLSDEDLEITLDSSEIDLDGSELGLGASDTNVAGMGSSDITLNAGESGINLATPTDSGISLERTPGEIAVGDEDEILELGEASEVEFEDVDEMLVDDVDGLQADDEFLLTPAGGDALEESDSGSQVIALDTEELGEDEATILQDDEGEELVTLPDRGGEVAPLPGAPGLAAAPETGYSLWNVLSLGTVMLPLLLAGLMMLDLVRHMWTWDEPYTINSTLMDFILSMFGS